jgi:hypothetical protein
MKGRVICVIAGVITALAGIQEAALAIQACPDSNSCAEVKVDVGTLGTLKVGDTFDAQLMFKQGPDSGQAGGIGKLAALALTLGIPGTGSAVPLTLATCALNADGFPEADVIPDASIASNFNVVVENANCNNGRTHCLCPDPGQPQQTRDNFINLVVYGPHLPLPTPGAGGIDIPTLPTGPQGLVTFKLKVNAAAGGEVPLHIMNQVTDTSRPQFTAFLSVGDKIAVDQTCVPIAGQPPCSTTESVSQVQMADATVSTLGCVGDCDSSGSVGVNEVVLMTNIALGTDQPSSCPAGDPANDGVQINDIVTAVNNALHGCPS